MPLLPRARRYLDLMSASDPAWGVEYNTPLTKEFKMDMARLEMPVSGWTCLRTRRRKLVLSPKIKKARPEQEQNPEMDDTFVDVGRVSLFSRLISLLFVAGGCRGLLASFLLLDRSLACGGLASSGGLLLGGFGSHFLWICEDKWNKKMVLGSRV